MNDANSPQGLDHQQAQEFRSPSLPAKRTLIWATLALEGVLAGIGLSMGVPIVTVFAITMAFMYPGIALYKQWRISRGFVVYIDGRMIEVYCRVLPNWIELPTYQHIDLAQVDKIYTLSEEYGALKKSRRDQAYYEPSNINVGALLTRLDAAGNLPTTVDHGLVLSHSSGAPKIYLIHAADLGGYQYYQLLDDILQFAPQAELSPVLAKKLGLNDSPSRSRERQRTL